MDSNDSKGDDTKQLDCWELKDPNKVISWTPQWSVYTLHLPFATSFVEDIPDPQCIDMKTKITEFDLKTVDVLNIICSSTRPNPYDFIIAIDLLHTPFEVLNILESLEVSISNEIKSTLHKEVLEKKWQT